MPYKDRETQLQAQRDAYQRRKAYYDGQNQERKQEIRDWFDRLKKTLACRCCGENHHACLDFHHRSPSEKDRAVSEMASHGYSKNRILDEMEKCDVLCANCHRKLHYEEGLADR